MEQPQVRQREQNALLGAYHLCVPTFNAGTFSEKIVAQNLFHNQEQSPGYPHGDGDCLAPACDCGSVPCGFYIWNHSTTTKVKGQTFQDCEWHTSAGCSAILRCLPARLLKLRAVALRQGSSTITS